MQTKIRPLMLAYTVIFGLLSIHFVYNDFTNEYSLIIPAWASICYIVMFAGNLLYSLNRVPSFFRIPWKIVFPILVLQFLFSFYYDSQHGKHAQRASATSYAIVSVIGVLLFLPTFRAHFLIGYGKQADDVA